MEFINQYGSDYEEESPQQGSFSLSSKNLSEEESLQQGSYSLSSKNLSEEESLQQGSFSFSSKNFYNSNTVASKGISLSTVQYEASENGHNDDHNEPRCHSRVSSTVEFGDYVEGPLDYNADDLECVPFQEDFIDQDQISESDISIQGDGFDNNYDEESEPIITEQHNIDNIDNIEHDVPHTDLDITIESEGSEYVPSKEEEEMFEFDKNSDEESKKIITEKKQKKSQKNKKKSQTKVDSPKIDLQSPKRMKLQHSTSTPKREKICLSPMSSPTVGSPTVGSPHSTSTPKRGKICLSPMSSPTVGLPTVGSPKSPNWTPLENLISDVDLYVTYIGDFLKEKMRNDDNVKKFLGGNQLPALDHISTQVHQNNKSGENQRKYDKSHICYFCGACVIKMSRHFIKKHNDNPDVRRFVNLKLNSKDRKNAITLLMLKGDFLHNCAVMMEQKGVLLVLRRPDANKPTKPEDHIPCVYCLGFVHKQQAYKHAKCRQHKMWVMQQHQ